MEQKEQGIQILIERIAAKKDELGLVQFRRNPSGPLDDKKIPAVLLNEGEDLIIRENSRSQTGYPARRKQQILLELIVNNKKTDPRVLYSSFRSVVFRDKDTGKIKPILFDDVLIKETRSVGPIGTGIPKVVQTTLVLDLVYTDDGV